MRPDETRFKPSRSRAGLAAIAIIAALGCTSTIGSDALKPIPFPGPPEEARFYWERTVIGTGAVKILGGEQKLRSLITGEAARGGEPLSKPFDVAVNRGRVFISDTVRRSVVVLDFVENRSFFVGDTGDDGELHKPLGVAVADDGTLFVSDGQRKRVMIYDRNGKYRGAVGGEESFDRPSGLDVNADGSRIFVVDTGGVSSENHRVRIFDVESGDHIRDIGLRGSDAGELNLPRDVSIGPDDLLYVSDGGNFRIQVFTQDGDFVREWGEPGKHLGQFTRLKGIATDADGNIYAVDSAFGNFQIFNPEGKLLLFIGARSTERGPSRFMLPAGIDVDEDGRVYMVDQFFRKLEVFRPANVEMGTGFFAGNPIVRPEEETAAELKEEESPTDDPTTDDATAGDATADDATAVR